MNITAYYVGNNIFVPSQTHQSNRSAHMSLQWYPYYHTRGDIIVVVVGCYICTPHHRIIRMRGVHIITGCSRWATGIHIIGVCIIVQGLRGAAGGGIYMCLCHGRRLHHCNTCSMRIP